MAVTVQGFAGARVSGSASSETRTLEGTAAPFLVGSDAVNGRARPARVTTAAAASAWRSRSSPASRGRRSAPVGAGSARGQRTFRVFLGGSDASPQTSSRPSAVAPWRMIKPRLSPPGELRRRCYPPVAMHWILWSVLAIGAAVLLNNLYGKPVPFLRWSFLRLLIGRSRLMKEWQVGDGREQRVVDYVLANAKPGDVDDAIRAIDEFAWQKSLLINVGDTKGAILDEALRAAKPKLVLELGAYIGYSALRMARLVAEGGKVCSVEFSAANAALAQQVVAHAGQGGRVSFVVGSLGDGGQTLATLEREHGFARGALDAVFLDHDKDHYLPDLQRILDRGWLHRGSVVVADNVKLPGAPEYRAYMQGQEGTLWRTVEHETTLEYQSLLQDLVLVSEYLGT